jgi:fatty acid desaturase
MVVFNTMLGGSASWWRGRHNRHHVSPNNVDVDLDIRTLPLIGWDEAQVREASKGGKINKHLRYQHLYFPFIGPPLLFVLYRVINAQWIITKRLGQEAIFTSIHFLFKFTVVFSMVGFSITQLLAWELITLVVGGAYLGWVFSLNHYMFPLLHDGANDDWVLSTTTTTQNVSGGKLLDFLTGHLDYQVEHHLFPRMPRHSYPAVHKSLKKLLASHGIELHVKSPITAVADVFKTLKDATRGLEPAKPAAPSASARMMLNMEEEERTLRRSTTISKSSDSVYSR